MKNSLIACLLLVGMLPTTSEAQVTTSAHGRRQYCEGWSLRSICPLVVASIA